MTFNFFRDTHPLNDGDFTEVQVLAHLAEEHPEMYNLARIKQQAIEIIEDVGAEELDRASAFEFAKYLNGRVAREGTAFLEEYSRSTVER